MQAQLQAARLQSAQNDLLEVRAELREAHSDNRKLSESLRTETHHADKLDLQVVHLKAKINQLKAKNRKLNHRRHRHDTESESDSESNSSTHEPMRQRRRYHQSTPSLTVVIASDHSDNLKARGAALHDSHEDATY